MTTNTTLVTGATGLVGNNTVRTLLERGCAVRVLVRKTSDLQPLEGLDVEIAEGDICDADSVTRACEGVGVVIHAAGYVQIGYAHLDRHRRINVEGTRNVAQATRAAGARLIHVSSADAIGIRSLEEPADEETPLGETVRCAYAITKREAEQVVLEEVGRGLDAVIVNPAFMLGPWDWRPSSGQMLLAVAKGIARIAPQGHYSVCDVRDVVDGILATVDRGRCGERYLLAGVTLSYLEAWQKFAEVTGAKPPWFAAPPPLAAIAGFGGDVWARLTGHEPDVNSAAIVLAKLPKNYTSAKAQRELGYSNRPLDVTVRDAWDWFVEHDYARPRRRAGQS